MINNIPIWDSKSANTQIGGVNLRKNKGEENTVLTHDQIDSSTTMST